MENVDESETAHYSGAGNVGTKESTSNSDMETMKERNTDFRKNSRNYSNDEEEDDNMQKANYSDRQSLKRRRPDIFDYKYSGHFVTLENFPETLSFKQIRTVIIKHLDASQKLSLHEMYIHTNGQNSYVIRFNTVDNSEMVIKAMNGKKIEGQIVTARQARESEYKQHKWCKIKEKKEKPSFSHSSSSSNSKFDMRPNTPKEKVRKLNQDWDSKETFGLNVNFLNELGINIIRKSVFVTNLDKETQTDKLREVFANAGYIINLQVMRNQEVAFARIEYDHPLEAVQAISMFHRKEVFGRNINVRMDFKTDPVLPVDVTEFGPGLGEFGTPLRHIRFMREMQSLKEHFIRETSMLRSRIDELNSKIMGQPKMLNSGPMQQTNMQNSSPMMNLNTQNMALGNMMANQPVNTSMFQNTMSNTNMQMMQNQTAQMNAMSGQVSQMSGQMNQPGWMGQTTDAMGQTSGYLNQSTSMAGQTSDQISGPWSQSTGMAGQTIDQMGPMSVQAGQMMNQLGQPMNQMTQPINQAGQMMSQTGQVMSQGVQNLNQLGQPMNQMGQMMTQSGSMMNQMGQMTNQRGQTLSNISDKKYQIDSEKNKRGQSDGRGDYMDNRPNYMAGNNFQSSQSESDNKRRISDMVIFKNLPRSITEAMLISKMRTVGDIKFAEITGNGKAIVRFMNSQAAARCIELFHRSKVDGKTIDVEYL